MKPGRRIWADNATWTAGPDGGTTTKLPQGLSSLANGRYRAQRPAPQLDNYELWNITERLDRAAAMRPMTLMRAQVTPTGWPAPVAIQACDGIFSPGASEAGSLVSVASPAYRHTIIYNIAGAAWEWQSIGGLLWPRTVGPIVAVGVVYPRLGIDPGNDIRAFIWGANALPQYSTAGAAWGAWAGGAPGAALYDIDYGGIGANARWVIGAAAGANEILVSTGPAAAFAPAAGALPGFAGAVSCVCHTHHYAGDVYPDDPGFDVWIALTATEASRSIDGQAQTWSAASLHGLGVIPLDVAYSKTSGTWIAICNDGNIARSTDGLAWTLDLTAIGSRFAGPMTSQEARITTDGFGHWIVTLAQSGTDEIEVWSSWDDGANWHAAYPQWAPVDPGSTNVNTCVWYGAGQFFIVHAEDNVPDGAIHVTLRTVD